MALNGPAACDQRCAFAVFPTPGNSDVEYFLWAALASWQSRRTYDPRRNAAPGFGAGSPTVPQMPSAGRRFQAFRQLNLQIVLPSLADPPAHWLRRPGQAGCRSGETLDSAAGRWHDGRSFEESKTARGLWSCQTLGRCYRLAERRLGLCRPLRTYLAELCTRPRARHGHIAGTSKREPHARLHRREPLGLRRRVRLVEQ